MYAYARVREVRGRFAADRLADTVSGAVVGLDEVAVQGRGAMGPGLMLRLVPADSPNPPMGLETARTTSTEWT